MMKNKINSRYSSAGMKLTVIGLFLLSLNACTPSGEGANPGLVESPLVYAKRTIAVDDDGAPVQYDVRRPLLFNAGGDLYIRTTTSSSVAEKNITRSVTGGIGDVKDVNSNYSGDKVVFSLRLTDPDPNDDADDPEWDIYEYNIITDQLRRVIAFDDTADDGNDISPAYLPDGRIVFSSDRQKGFRESLGVQSASGFSKAPYSAVVEDNNTEVKALVLHVMDSDGDNIRQITFNQSHDLDPVVMPNGRILFSRWDRAGGNNSVNLYTVNPDGSDLQIYYGDHATSHRDVNNDVIQFTKPRVMSDGRIMVLARPFTNTYSGGDLLLIDGENYVDIRTPTHTNLNILSGPAQVKATTTNVSNAAFRAGRSAAGRYGSFFPLQDGSNRLLISKGTCQLTNDDIDDPNIVVRVHPCIEPYISAPIVTEMPPAYGLWLYNLGNNTERPLLAAEPGYILTDAIVVQPYDRQTIISDRVLVGFEAALATDNLGLLHIRSVYDMDGAFNCSLVAAVPCLQTTPQALGDLTISVTARPARFLRLLKPVGIPDGNEAGQPDLINRAFGPSRNLGMREILGYSMIEPDGSVKVKVPANVAFGIEVLDASGRRIGRRHDNWLQVMPGETLNCNGCHVVPGGNNPPLPLPHGRRNAVAAAVNTGMAADGAVLNSEIPNSAIPGEPVFTYVGHYQETMAEVRSRTNPAALTPSVDVVFNDEWRVVAALEASTSLSYTDLSTVEPISSANVCRVTGWNAGCRTVINYVDHIMPLWESTVDRPAGACIACHNQAGIIAANSDSFQLELTNAKDTAVPDHEVSYRELLFADNLQEVVNGMLQDRLVDDLNDPILDANNQPVLINGVPQFNQIPVPAPVVMSAQNGARGSYFFEKLTGTELNAARTLDNTSHANFLTAAELRLLAEWLDIGAQYYNNPYAPLAPQN